MKKYIVVLKDEKDFTAASKAREDTETIAEGMGYIPFCFSGERTAKRNPFRIILLAWKTVRNWRSLSGAVEPGSLILLQYPHYPMKTAYLMRRILPGMRKRKGVHFIFLIHDLNSLRGTFGKAAVYSDSHLLQLADAVICHNAKMKEFLLQQGLQEDRIISLGLFDYLTDKHPGEHHLRDGIAIAGNLEPGKSGYVGQLLEEIPEAIPVHLYGPGFPEKKRRKNVVYHGAVPAGELPGRMEGGFGLVWDGPSTKSCEGKAGNYLRVNNPHKLSLYLTAGLPVIVWKEAATADTVQETGTGMTVKNLDELAAAFRTTTEADYLRMRENARKTGSLLREGQYIRQALYAAEARIRKG